MEIFGDTSIVTFETEVANFKMTLPQKNGHRIKTPSSKLMILVSFCWENNSIRIYAHSFFILSLVFLKLLIVGVAFFLGHPVLPQRRVGEGGGGAFIILVIRACLPRRPTFSWLAAASFCSHGTQIVPSANMYGTAKKKRPCYLVGNLVATNWPIEKALHAIGYNQIPTK